MISRVGFTLSPARRIALLFGLAATLLAGPAFPKRYNTSYGSMRSTKELHAGRQTKILSHFNREGHALAISKVVFDATTGRKIHEATALEMPIAKGSAKTLAQILAARLIRSVPDAAKPTAVAAVVDIKNGRVFYGASGGKAPRRIHPTLKRKMPRVSFEHWQVENCAEFRALNKALLAGAVESDLETHTVRAFSGKTFPPCHNCQITTTGTLVSGSKISSTHAEHRGPDFNAKSGTLTIPLPKMQVSTLPDYVRREAKDFQAKADLHVTVVGFRLARKIKKAIKHTPELKEQLDKLVASTNWSFAPTSSFFQLRKTYGTPPITGQPENTRHSIVQMLNMPGLVTFYAKLGTLLGEKIDVPPAHLTLFTSGDPAGIGVASVSEFLGAAPRAIVSAESLVPFRPQ